MDLQRKTTLEGSIIERLKMILEGILLFLLCLNIFSCTQTGLKEETLVGWSVRGGAETTSLRNHPSISGETSYEPPGTIGGGISMNINAHSGDFTICFLTDSFSFWSVRSRQALEMSGTASLVLAQHTGKDSTFTGRYVNHQYGYSVVIPKGTVGFAASPPSPQHGFGIILSHQPKAEIWVDGAYNAALFDSLETAATTHLNRLAKNDKLEVLKRTPVQLHGLRAIRLTSRYIDRESGMPMREEFVTAIRKHKGEVGIVYEISLTTPESRYEKDKVVFEKLIGSWRLTSLP